MTWLAFESTLRGEGGLNNGCAVRPRGIGAPAFIYASTVWRHVLVACSDAIMHPRPIDVITVVDAVSVSLLAS